jgi:hypothetical protein
MEKLDINKVESELYEKIHSAVLESMNCVYSKIPAPHEPDFVAILTICFTEDLFNVLKSFFPNYKFGITGIFCHLKPIANFYGNGVELGDLLFIYKYTDENNKETYNSLLTQAKIAKNLSKIKPKDKKQLELYTTWPKFTYSKAGPLNGQERDIYCKEPTIGAQYLLLDDNPVSAKKYPGVFPIGFAKVILDMSYYRVYPDFSKDLIKFLKFENGRKFEAEKDIPKDCTNWSQMIWDLISISKNSCSKRKNIGLFNRYHEYDNSYMQESDLDTPLLFDGSTNRITHGGEGAPSVICIETKKVSTNQ